MSGVCRTLASMVSSFTMPFYCRNKNFLVMNLPTGISKSNPPLAALHRNTDVQFVRHRAFKSHCLRNTSMFSQLFSVACTVQRIIASITALLLLPAQLFGTRKINFLQRAFITSTSELAWCLLHSWLLAKCFVLAITPSSCTPKIYSLAVSPVK